MIRILHTIDTTGPGGAETVFINLIKGIDSKRFKVYAAISGPGWVCNTLRQIGFEPIYLKSKGSLSIRYLTELVKILRKNKIDIIQSHLFGSNLYCSLAGMLCRVKVISTFHGFVDTGKGNFIKKKLKFKIINIGSQRIVFVSDKLRKHFLDDGGVSLEKSLTINNGVDTESFKIKRDSSIREKFGIRPENILIGTLGNIRYAKGYEYFLKAAKIIHDKISGCRFVIAGEASGKLYFDLLALRKKLELEEVFFFYGFCDDAANYLNNLNCFVLSSITEGFSISTVQAMACGLPIVVTKSGGPEEIIKDEVSGLYSDPKNEVDLANQILRLINDSSLRNKVANNAFQQANINYPIEKMIQNYNDLYFNIMNE
jgi:glycosyltransferase involved in cell wall biosynthesis